MSPPAATVNDRIRQPTGSQDWLFAKVPRQVSEALLRRGRITASIAIGSSKFDALMQPDGALGHWFEIPAWVLQAHSLQPGDALQFTIATLDKQPEPQAPPAFLQQLGQNPTANATWQATTTLARIDWVHWMQSAKQLHTRRKREADAIDMLAEGKKRVCCFDPSGVYSKAFQAPAEG